MNRTRAFHAILAAVAVAAAAAAPLPAATPPNFHVVATGPVGFELGFPGCPAGAAHVTGSAPASGTQIGGTGTLVTSECAQPDFVHQINHVDGTAVLTATGGDSIFIHYGGESPLPNFTTGDLSEDLSFTITGGTGHFSDASGGGHLRTHGNFFVVVTAELDGTIAMRSH